MLKSYSRRGQTGKLRPTRSQRIELLLGFLRQKVEVEVLLRVRYEIQTLYQPQAYATLSECLLGLFKLSLRFSQLSLKPTLLLSSAYTNYLLYLRCYNLRSSNKDQSPSLSLVSQISQERIAGDLRRSLFKDITSRRGLARLRVLLGSGFR